MSEVRPPKNCGLFKPGHNPHWIQAKKGWEEKVDVPVPGRLISTSDDDTIVIEMDGQQLHLWNHEPQRIAEAAEASGGTIEYQDHWGLLWVPSKDGRYAFCVTRSPDAHVPCPLQPPVGSPMELLESAGGVTLRVDDLRVIPLRELR